MNASAEAGAQRRAGATGPGAADVRKPFIAVCGQSRASCAGPGGWVQMETVPEVVRRAVGARHHFIS